jgi:5'-3' exoribonuclease 2
MCFLVGNDFIPHMPSLRITEGGVDCLLILYKHHLKNGYGYITNCGNVNLKALSSFFRLIGNVEEGLMRG